MASFVMIFGKRILSFFEKKPSVIYNIELDRHIEISGKERLCDKMDGSAITEAAESA